MRRSAVPAATLWLALIGCQPDHTEQAKQVVDQGVAQAKQGAQQAKQGVEQGVEQAKQGIADARERYDVDERVAEAQARFATGMDEAADSFSDLAKAGAEGAADISAAIDEQGKAGIEGAAEAIHCKPDPKQDQATRCKIGEELLAKLKDQPKLLAREIMLLPKQGKTGAGLELVRLGDKSVPELLGLSRKDILLELNGTSLGSLDAIRYIDEALAGKSAAEIVYERDGERKTLVLERE